MKERGAVGVDGNPGRGQLYYGVSKGLDESSHIDKAAYNF